MLTLLGKQGLEKVPITHHPTLGDIISNKYLKLMFKIPKNDHQSQPLKKESCSWRPSQGSEIDIANLAAPQHRRNFKASFASIALPPCRTAVPAMSQPEWAITTQPEWVISSNYNLKEKHLWFKTAGIPGSSPILYIKAGIDSFSSPQILLFTHTHMYICF